MACFLVYPSGLYPFTKPATEYDSPWHKWTPALPKPIPESTVMHALRIRLSYRECYNLQNKIYIKTKKINNLYASTLSSQTKNSVSNCWTILDWKYFWQSYTILFCVIRSLHFESATAIFPVVPTLFNNFGTKMALKCHIKIFKVVNTVRPLCFFPDRSDSKDQSYCSTFNCGLVLFISLVSLQNDITDDNKNCRSKKYQKAPVSRFTTNIDSWYNR